MNISKTMNHSIPFIVILLVFYSFVGLSVNILNDCFSENIPVGESKDSTHAITYISRFADAIEIQGSFINQRSVLNLKDVLQKHSGRNNGFYRPTSIMVLLENYVGSPCSKELQITAINKKGYLSVLSLSLGGNSPPLANV